MLYLSAERTAYTEIDSELAAAARVFTGAALNSPAPAPDRSSPVQLAMAAPTNEDTPSHLISEVTPRMIDLSAEAPQTGHHIVPVWLRNIPQDCLGRLGWDESQQPYFVVWSSDGSILRQSSKYPDFARVSLVSVGSGSPNSPRFEDRGDVREIIASGPDSSTILIGRSIRREQAGLASLRCSLLAGGSMIMIVGLAGGFAALTRRALRPIAAISNAAQAISASDLSRRIERENIKSRASVTALARTRNGTFDRLEAAFQQQAQFTADASHELRTPLAVIHAGSEFALARACDRSAGYRDALESNLRASKRMNTLVESLLCPGLGADADAARPKLFVLRSSSGRR